MLTLNSLSYTSASILHPLNVYAVRTGFRYYYRHLDPIVDMFYSPMKSLPKQPLSNYRLLHLKPSVSLVC
jgi:hypothetical protein